MEGRIIDAEVLLYAVQELSQNGIPIITSEALRHWFVTHGYDWGEHERGRIGRFFEQADNEATTRGLLTKWKKRGGRTAPVGWSLPDTRPAANAWAKEHDWSEV